jgi:hypothetical protein
MEQFAISIKMRYKEDGAAGRQLCFPKGIIIPECLTQKKASEINYKQKVISCHACGKEGLGETVVNAITSAP